MIDGVDLFDAAFFGITAREAELMDPQQRIFLELCWEAWSTPATCPRRRPAPIGVFAGMYNATYFQRHVLAHPDKVARLGEFQVMLANEKDYIATRVAYKLDLTGPAVSVHTACSTSLVGDRAGLRCAARRSVRPGAGRRRRRSPARRTAATSIRKARCCRPTATRAPSTPMRQGTVFSRRRGGRAAQAPVRRARRRRHDPRGDPRRRRSTTTAPRKVSFTAPSVEGQAAVVAAALGAMPASMRAASPTSRPTARPRRSGDPIEVAALNAGLPRPHRRRGFCAIGSLKSNIGHLVIAAGAAGLIKTALALTAERLPGTAHFKTPNPKIDFARQPVHRSGRRRPPGRAARSPAGPASARSAWVARTRTRCWKRRRCRGASDARGGPAAAAPVGAHPPGPGGGDRSTRRCISRPIPRRISPTSPTRSTGRRDFAQRAFVAAQTVAEATAALRASDRRAWPDPLSCRSDEPAPVLLFPGQGAQYAGMGRALYAHRPAFARAFDELLAALSQAACSDPICGALCSATTPSCARAHGGRPNRPSSRSSTRWRSAG